MLKVIDTYHRDKIKIACKHQFGNGTRNGCEIVIYTLRKMHDDLQQSGNCIITLDASNAYNRISRNTALEAIFDKTPGTV